MELFARYHVIQTILAFFSTLIYARILGKTQISQLSFYDYVNGITMGSIAATIAVEKLDRTAAGLACLTIFSLLTYCSAYITLKNRRMRKLIEGEPTIVISKGKINAKNMASMRYDLDELTAQLRGKDIFHMSEVDYAILEADGQLSVLKKQAPPVLQYKGFAVEVILDGEIITENLSQAGIDEIWLRKRLQEYGISDASQVMYASVDENKNFYIGNKT